MMYHIVYNYLATVSALSPELQVRWGSLVAATDPRRDVHAWHNLRQALADQEAIDVSNVHIINVIPIVG
jgi:hypothetical protein